MNHPFSQEDIALLKKAYNTDIVNTGVLAFIFIFGAGMIALQSFGGDIPFSFALTILASFLGVFGWRWRLKRDLKKDMALGTYRIEEGIVTTATRGSIKTQKRDYKYPYKALNPFRKGDKVRIYMADATQMIFRIEKIAEVFPDVL